ncbi:MAG: hypothetical protein K6T85_18990, partial [Gorillibacterium sp.]|nr:hypothetical protein [Gorillibacterium sp.]
MIPHQYWDYFHLSPGGVSIATDSTCKEILHNQKAASLLRIKSGENFSHSAENPPNVKVLKDGIQLLPNELPIQRSAASGIKVSSEVLEFVWEDGRQNFSSWNSQPIF